MKREDSRTNPRAKGRGVEPGPLGVRSLEKAEPSDPQARVPGDAVPLGGT